MDGHFTETQRNDTIILDEPAVIPGKPSLTDIFSLVSLQNPFKPEAVGTVEGREEFSLPLPRAEEKKDVDAYIFIKAPGTKFYVPEKFRQFLPVIEAAVKDHYANNRQTPLDYCTINVMQTAGLLHGTGPHIDANFHDIFQKTMLNNNTYIAYDKAPTWFFDQPFTVDDSGCQADSAAAGARIYKQMQEQASKESVRTFAPFSIVHFDSSNVHQGFAIENMGERTVCVVAFCPRTYSIPPDRLRNPALQEVLETRSANPAPAESLNP